MASNVSQSRGKWKRIAIHWLPFSSKRAKRKFEVEQTIVTRKGKRALADAFQLDDPYTVDMSLFHRRQARLFARFIHTAAVESMEAVGIFDKAKQDALLKIVEKHDPFINPDFEITIQTRFTPKGSLYNELSGKIGKVRARLLVYQFERLRKSYLKWSERKQSITRE